MRENGEDVKDGMNVPYIVGEENASQLSLSQHFTVRLKTDLKGMHGYVLTMYMGLDGKWMAVTTDTEMVEWTGGDDRPITLEKAHLKFIKDVKPGDRVQVTALLVGVPNGVLGGKYYTVIP